MRLVPYDRSKLKRRNSDNYTIIDEFVQSGLECAKVEGWTQAQSSSATNSLNSSIKRFRFANVRAIAYKKEVYLIKTN
jgi:hypothetical protein